MRRPTVILLALVLIGVLSSCGSGGHPGNNTNSKMGYQMVNLTNAPLRVILSSSVAAGVGGWVPAGWQIETTLATNGDHMWYPPCDPVFVFVPDLHPGAYWDISTTDPVNNPDEPPFDHFVYSTYDGGVNITCFSVPQFAPSAARLSAARAAAAPRKAGYAPMVSAPAAPHGGG